MFVVGLIFLFFISSVIPSLVYNIEKPIAVSNGNWLYVGKSRSGNYGRIQDAVQNYLLISLQISVIITRAS